jgi:hypothetical protein
MLKKIVGMAVAVPVWLVLIGGPTLAWSQHLYTCFTQGLWGFLIAGAIFFPIGVVHGAGIWLGIWGGTPVQQAGRETAGHMAAALNWHNKAAEITSRQGTEVTTVSREDYEMVRDYNEKALAEAKQADIASMNRFYPGLGDHFQDEFIRGEIAVAAGLRGRGTMSAAADGIMLMNQFGDWYEANLSAIHQGRGETP